MVESPPGGHAAATRVVLLGASNLTRAISTIAAASEQLLGPPLDVLAALGHGRSYGMPSRVLGRQLPGILQCGLWDDLAARPPAARNFALVTDVGNDLVYGVSVGEILDWVDTCLGRLADAGYQTVLTGLPIGPIRALPRWRFNLIRRLLFPSHRIDLAQIQSAAEDLQVGLEHLATARHATFCNPQASWYGWDPIHIRIRHWAPAWGKILAPWQPTVETVQVAGSLRRWAYLRRLRPATRRFWGREQIQTQPAGQLPTGTRVSLY